MKFPRLLTHTLAVVFLLSLSQAQAAPVRVAYSAISGAMAPLWVTQEGGYFRREGLDVELLYIGGGSLLIQSILGGRQFAYGPSVRWLTRLSEARSSVYRQHWRHLIFRS
jgi:ABC-type nitrate/sulfonate/bicarbonate transport system substrate-binding protein